MNKSVIPILKDHFNTTKLSAVSLALTIALIACNTTPKNTDSNGTRKPWRSDVPNAAALNTGFISDQEWVTATSTYGPVSKNLAYGEGNPSKREKITLSGTQYDKGLGTHADSSITFKLDPSCSRFKASIGLDDQVRWQTEHGNVLFQVYGDNNALLFDSKAVDRSTPTKDVDVDVSGQTNLKLVVDQNRNSTEGDQSDWYDQADWANARVECAGTSNPPPAPNPTPSSLKIQFEDFNQGGEGVGYHDNNAANLGKLYRPSEGVDIEARANPDGYNVGWIEAGEWLKYDLNVTSEGSYALSFRLSSLPNAGDFEISVDDGAQALRLNAQDVNAGLDVYRVVSAGKLNLSAGKHVLKVLYPYGEQTVNLDWMELVKAGSTPTPPPSPSPSPTPPPPTPTPPPAPTGQLFYVAQNGNDNNPGNETQPWRTIQKATQALTAGQTALVKNGTYVGGLYMDRSGQPGKPIIFQAFPGDSPKIEISDGSQQGFEIKGASYVTIDGFEVEYTAPGADQANGERYQTGIAISDGANESISHHIVIRNNRIHRFPGAGIGAVKTDYITLEGNTVWENAFWSKYDTSGISFYQSVDVDSQGGFHNIIRGNNVFNNENRVPFFVTNPLKITDGNCIILDDARHTQTLAGGPQYPAYKGATLIENNICSGNGARGIEVYSSDNVLVRHNTLYKNLQTPNIGGGELFALDASNVRFVNNIVYADAGQPGTTSGNSSNITFERNLYFGTNNIPDRSSSDIVGVDPMFENPSTDVNTANFRLRAGSPAIDKALASESPATDIVGQSRPLGAGPDLGAWESR